MTPAARNPKIVVIGAGLAGITTAHVLREHGFSDITVLEKGTDVGGVWHWNQYPGLCCDVPSQIYQFRFAPKPDWNHIFASGAEIQQYHRDVVDRLGLTPLIRLNTEVVAAQWQDPQQVWTVTAAGGGVYTADFLICATGVLHHPSAPNIAGLDDFAGAVVHTACWDDGLDTTGKRVAVIGTGSTGVQIVSALQPGAASLRHYVRTPQWILWAPTSLPQLPGVAAVLSRLPRLHTAIYDLLLWGSGILADITTRPSWRRRAAQAYARLCLRLQVRDKTLRKKLTPDSQPLCKRQVVSGTYYQAIQSANAELAHRVDLAAVLGRADRPLHRAVARKIPRRNGVNRRGHRGGDRPLQRRRRGRNGADGVEHRMQLVVFHREQHHRLMALRSRHNGGDARPPRRTRFSPRLTRIQSPSTRRV